MEGQFIHAIHVPFYGKMLNWSQIKASQHCRWIAVAGCHREGMELGAGTESPGGAERSSVPTEKTDVHGNGHPSLWHCPFFFFFFIPLVVAVAAARLVFQGTEITKRGRREQHWFCHSFTNRLPHMAAFCSEPALSQELHLLSYNINPEQPQSPNGIFFRLPRCYREKSMCHYAHSLFLWVIVCEQPRSRGDLKQALPSAALQAMLRFPSLSKASCVLLVPPRRAASSPTVGVDPSPAWKCGQLGAGSGGTLWG